MSLQGNVNNDVISKLQIPYMDENKKDTIGGHCLNLEQKLIMR